MSFKEAISVKGCKFCVATREDEANKVLVLGNLNLNRLLAAFSIFLAQLAQPILSTFNSCVLAFNATQNNRNVRIFIIVISKNI